MSTSLSIVVWSKEGCHYCDEIKEYLKINQIPFQTVDVTKADDRRDILEVKYDVRHVPVVEIGKNGIYEGITELGLDHVKKAIARHNKHENFLSL